MKEKSRQNTKPTCFVLPIENQALRNKPVSGSILTSEAACSSSGRLVLRTLEPRQETMNRLSFPSRKRVMYATNNIICSWLALWLCACLGCLRLRGGACDVTFTVHNLGSSYQQFVAQALSGGSWFADLHDFGALGPGSSASWTA